MQLKWWQAVGAVSVLALAVPACSKDDKKDDKTTATTAAKTADTTATTAAESPDTTEAATETTKAASGDAPAPGTPVEVALKCSTPNTTIKAVADPLEFTLKATTEAPEKSAKGSSADVKIDYVMSMPDKLVGVASDMQVPSVDIKDFVVEATVSGGGTGGPLAAAPTAYSVTMSPLNVPTTTATGSVSIADDATPTDITLTKVQFTVIVPVVLADGAPITCEFPQTVLARINA